MCWFGSKTQPPPATSTTSWCSSPTTKRTREFPIYVGGRIVPQISVSPESLLLGDVAQGQQVSKKIIVHGKKPFKIVSIQCDDEDCFQFKTDNESKDRHIVEITFNAKKNAGNVKEAIQHRHRPGRQLSQPA